MKKAFLLGMLFAATVCNAQVVLWNGEDKEVNSDGGFWNRADPKVVEEGGNKCLKIMTKAKTGDWDNEHFNAHLHTHSQTTETLKIGITKRQTCIAVLLIPATRVSLQHQDW